MANYKYKKTVLLEKGTNVILTIEIPVPGTAASHLIDLPGDDNDLLVHDWYEKDLGPIDDLVTDRTLIISNVININPSASEIKLDYKINGNSIVAHSNRKEDDRSPQVIITLRFIQIDA